ncbi:hypothetical protein NKH58_22750 [Mesorhizobium australicum]|uniref:hypothetical protein n=1 Tax=Mesorhizobium australicum TaxID=536018 RepID=UPI00333CE8A0
MPVLYFCDRGMPCGRFRVIAYSPKKGVDWCVSWQETEQEALGTLIPKIVETLKAAKDNVQRLMDAEDVAAAKRKKEREEEWERYLSKRMPARQIKLLPIASSSLRKLSKGGERL